MESRAADLTVSTSADVQGIEPSECFDLFVESLSKSLTKKGMHFEKGSSGSISENGVSVGKVISWHEGKEILLDWNHIDEASKITFAFEQRGDDTRITLSWDRPMGGDTALGWFAEMLAPPFLKASRPSNFGDWFTDRRARKPSGPEARKTYGNPVYHKPNFYAILDVLKLIKDDYLLEVGCGGGVFLSWALKSGCKAEAIDHSPDMIELARETNATAIRERRVIIQLSEADLLPFSNSTFTCAAMTGVFAFLPDPLKALSEIYRVLKNDGRFVMFTGSKELKGTPAAPEPMASRLHFYEDEELGELARKAGFANARVDHPDMSGYAEKSGVPEDAIPFFRNTGAGQLLVGSK
jgi:SAM-dependent methyltransferase